MSSSSRQMFLDVVSRLDVDVRLDVVSRDHMCLSDLRRGLPGLHPEFGSWRRGCSHPVEGEFSDEEREEPLTMGLCLLCLQLYQEHQGQIRSALHWLPHKLPAYHNLEWRLDVQVCDI